MIPAFPRHRSAPESHVGQRRHGLQLHLRRAQQPAAAKVRAAEEEASEGDSFGGCGGCGELPLLAGASNAGGATHTLFVSLNIRQLRK